MLLLVIVLLAVIVLVAALVGFGSGWGGGAGWGAHWGGPTVIRRTIVRRPMRRVYEEPVMQRRVYEDDFS
jgi:hypothetical protein